MLWTRPELSTPEKSPSAGRSSWKEMRSSTQPRAAPMQKWPPIPRWRWVVRRTSKLSGSGNVHSSRCFPTPRKRSGDCRFPCGRPASPFCGSPYRIGSSLASDPSGIVRATPSNLGRSKCAVLPAATAVGDRCTRSTASGCPPGRRTGGRWRQNVTPDRRRRAECSALLVGTRTGEVDVRVIAEYGATVPPRTSSAPSRCSVRRPVRCPRDMSGA